MGICSAKRQKNVQIKEHGEQQTKQTLQNDYSLDIQRQVRSERSIKSIKPTASSPKQVLSKFAATPSTRQVKHMVWADQIVENAGFRGTLKTWVSIKNAQFSKHYTMLSKDQFCYRIKQLDHIVVVQHNLSGRIMVAEMIKKTDQGIQLIESIVKTQLYHPNLTRIFEIFQDSNNYQIIHDFCNGPLLSQHLHKCVYTQQQAALILKQMIEIVKHLHQYEVNHGGLTLASFQKCNQSNSNFIKLVDFKPIYLKSYISEKDIFLYMSPEAIKFPEDYTPARDVWSIGVIFYQMLTGEFPFKGNNKEEVFEEIMNYSVQEDLNSQCLPPESVDIIKRFFKFDPAKRINLNQVLNDHWLKHNIETQYEEQKLIVKQLENNHQLSFLQCCFLQFMISTFSADQEQILYQLFGQFDVNHDGKISKQDLTIAYIKHFSSIQEVKEHVDAVFKGIDINKNGEIDFQEFLIGVINKETLITEDNLKETFKILSDVEGFISLSKICTLYHNKKQQLKQQFSVYENNQINFNQFQQLMFDAL
ncbi:unnamed protein product (macronuclear) [Paramecium tetraurelia]|uniref:Protein kinase domain-containing protein n=1 Tax=Paramecium tetraurelia TaxID=5888 RepID=A0CG42_PARTE|nr:uncharacterized protein GSPATT00038203001 [Paramecium tetraurelia]CAK69759.1 unnamed protein product [Paramecium tetraurelia]|eukprot:XP_001437156.1 hypothetical protein (macronuclear) [Paramecium tetraurelia strain d4-2]